MTGKGDDFVPRAPDSRPGVCEVRFHAAADGTGDGRPELLIEVPHGATTSEQYHAVRDRLSSRLPEGLERFYFVNTDVGAPEVAGEIAQTVAASGVNVLFVRGLVPRTFIDFNRNVDGDGEGMTLAIPPYVDDAQDVELLRGLHAQYRAVTERAYARVAGAGGLALLLHTYAPRSVGIEKVDERIVEQLRVAYAAGTYETWELRPEVDLICETLDGRVPVLDELLADVERRYSEIDVETTRSKTYRLHPATLGHHWAETYPGKTLSVEIRRDLLADPFRPFEEMRIGAAKVKRMAAPLAEALVAQLSSKATDR